MSRKKTLILLRWGLILLAAIVVVTAAQRWITSLAIDEFFWCITNNPPEDLEMLLRNKKHIIFSELRRNKKYLDDAINPVIFCANMKQNRMVKIILAHGYLQYCPETTSRLMAYFPDDKNVVEELYRHGIDPNALDDDRADFKCSLLISLIGPFPSSSDGWEAERQRRLETIRFLIQCGVDVNAGSWQRGENEAEEILTPLLWAAHKGNIELLRILLAAGANPRATDASGRTAADHCRIHRNSFRSAEEFNEALDLLRTYSKEK